ncbi:ethanolamine kinase [Sitodiplosis mosellana]|uniref:ethanolamine kinase n=1 Tax=Sitodiplosis mosellana TaxID=263140 RepID=UPI002444A7F7|nr:ethanolamine kinase [Sitodiplosis mosellana]XP_055322725.1 ethanolamine kinase [Sitodiplosis mosellana]XP_055322726.1 ethanolamine kinase [Sitodiplosis mosellana]
MCSDQNHITGSISNHLENGQNDPICVAVTIDINDISDGALKVLKQIKPFWPINNVQFKIFTNGTTNKLIGCCIPKHNNNDEIPLGGEDNLNRYEVILIRIYGKNTEVLIDRQKEVENFKSLHRYGFAPKLLATFNNGLAYEYTDGKPLSKSDVYDEQIWRKIAQRMAEMHRDIDCVPLNEPVLWKKINKFFDLIPTKYSNPVTQQRREELLPPIHEIRAEFNRLYAVVSKIKSPVVFAHNDLLLGNILYDTSAEIVTFIDYEYADYNFQAFEIGNHFTEFAGMTDIDYTLYPPKEYQLDWLREYLTHYHKHDSSVVTDEYVHQLYADVNKFALVAHFFWLIWGHIQAEHSEIDYDFLEFASLRYNEYLAKRDAFLSL